MRQLITYDVSIHTHVWYVREMTAHTRAHQKFTVESAPTRNSLIAVTMRDETNVNVSRELTSGAERTGWQHSSTTNAQMQISSKNGTNHSLIQFKVLLFHMKTETIIQLSSNVRYLILE